MGNGFIETLRAMQRYGGAKEVSNAPSAAELLEKEKERLDRYYADYREAKASGDAEELSRAEARVSTAERAVERAEKAADAAADRFAAGNGFRAAEEVSARLDAEEVSNAPSARSGAAANGVAVSSLGELIEREREYLARLIAEEADEARRVEVSDLIEALERVEGPVPVLSVSRLERALSAERAAEAEASFTAARAAEVEAEAKERIAFEERRIANARKSAESAESARSSAKASRLSAVRIIEAAPSARGSAESFVGL